MVLDGYQVQTSSKLERGGQSVQTTVEDNLKLINRITVIDEILTFILIAINGQSIGLMAINSNLMSK